MEKTNKRKHEIYLGRPARYWDDGLPIGNGRLSAMVMGKPNEETIFINEEPCGTEQTGTGKIQIP